jgi:hypothetical protein
VTSRFTELIVDAHDMRLLADFWCSVLSFHVLEESDSFIEIGERQTTADSVIAGAIPPTIVFVPVPEGKTVKNRVHVDVSPIDRSQQEEVDRLTELGAHRIDIGQGDQPWVVMADPEGNEFCVLRTLKP